MAHLVLLGDSIFDNGVYVPGHPDVVRQVRAALPAGWMATLLAVDGAVIRSVPAQFARIPSDATHLAVSVGGNDALSASGMLGARAGTVAEAVGMLAQVQAGFAGEYSEMAAQVAARGLPTALCTIYDTRVMEPDHRIIKAALALVNDVITRTAFRLGMPLVGFEADLLGGCGLRQSDRTLGGGRGEDRPRPRPFRGRRKRVGRDCRLTCDNLF